MPIHFRCRHCRVRLSITRRKAGMQITCPSCTQQIRVPRLDQARSAKASHQDKAGGKPIPPLPTNASSEQPAFATASSSSIGKHEAPPPPLGAPSPGPVAVPLSAPQRGAGEQRFLSTAGRGVVDEPVSQPRQLGIPVSPGVPSPAPVTGTSTRSGTTRPTSSAEPPLFEKDIDTLLNALPDPQPSSRRKPAPAASSGIDAAMVLDQAGPPSEQTQRIMAIVAIAFTLAVLAFLAGLFVSLHH
ncbi:MAG: hypothetical protein NZ703_04820 [Gemmataceae bacterium]|nr:hypothetical protein [Gemmataceae bacterium]MCS7270388.1 hypothetical protein [Gemmataceae bacterium]MDW8244353.1 hypothetical protein [Thermogemmata sp.]